MGSRFVAITDNADPMAVLVYDRRPQVTGRRLGLPPARVREGCQRH